MDSDEARRNGYWLPPALVDILVPILLPLIDRLHTKCEQCGQPSTKVCRCKTQYCCTGCQTSHWPAHKKLCKRMTSAGGVEQFRANARAEEAAAAAVDACAEATAGLTCFICHRGGDLVRGCACRGTAGAAHVACLAEQARVATEDETRQNEDGFNFWWLCAASGRRRWNQSLDACRGRQKSLDARRRRCASKSSTAWCISPWRGDAGRNTSR